MRISFYQARSGRSYISSFLEDLSAQDRATILAVLSDIQSHGFVAKGCQFRQIEGKLWEIKIRTQGGSYRFFYVSIERNEVYILHAYRKQGQKAPIKELEIARKRIKEVLL